MKKIFNIILYVVVAVTISGCVMLKVYPTEKDKKSESSLLKAVDPTAIPTGETWETVRGVIDDNFDNVNGTLDSIEITLSEYGDSITNYSTNKLNISDTASMLEPYALTSELADAGTDVGLSYFGLAPDIGVFEYGDETDSTATNVITFTLSEQTGAATINTTNHTVSIEVDYTADITNLTPTITLSYGATVSPLSGVSQDFTSPVTYTVTALDGVTEQEWVITVTQEEEPEEPAGASRTVKFRGLILKV